MLVRLQELPLAKQVMGAMVNLVERLLNGGEAEAVSTAPQSRSPPSAARASARLAPPDAGCSRVGRIKPYAKNEK
jgi:hypothetical protein